MNHSSYLKNTRAFSEQTHFIGVLVPQQLTNTLLDCRNWMNVKYGCQSGFGTPIHVTLVPPFHLAESYTTNDVLQSLQNAVEELIISNDEKTADIQQEITLYPEKTINTKQVIMPYARQPSAIHSLQIVPFTAHVRGFDAFDDRTIFAKVLPDEHWQKLRDTVIGSLLKSCPGTTKKDKRPFTPHLTIANRDIPPGASVGALAHFEELNLTSEFSIKEIAVFTRNEGIWYAEDENILRIK